jgi:cytochrome P450
MTQAPFLRQITDYANRANPYPLYTELRKTPVLHEGDGGPYAISTYWDIQSLLHDPRISSDASNLTTHGGDELPEQEGGDGSAAQLPAARPSGARPAASDDQPSVRPPAQSSTCPRNA